MRKKPKKRSSGGLTMLGLGALFFGGLFVLKQIQKQKV